MIFHPLYWVLPQIFDAKDVEVFSFIDSVSSPPPSTNIQGAETLP